MRPNWFDTYVLLSKRELFFAEYLVEFLIQAQDKRVGYTMIGIPFLVNGVLFKGIFSAIKTFPQGLYLVLVFHYFLAALLLHLHRPSISRSSNSVGAISISCVYWSASSKYFRQCSSTCVLFVMGFPFPFLLIGCSDVDSQAFSCGDS